MSKSKSRPNNKIVVLINNREKFKGRLVGLIDEEECRALLNVKDAAKKVFTSESVNKETVETSLAQRKRFVVACEDRTIFISPRIRYTSWISGGRILRCEDNNEYIIKAAL
jgi:hypothetical protein